MSADPMALGDEATLPDELRLPLLLLSQYVFFLSRRPISESNLHYLVSRLEGLQSLSSVLAGSGNPALEQVVSQLLALHPAAFRTVAPSLQLSLIPLVTAAWPLPSHIVVQDSGPPRDWLAGVRRTLLVFGPGIGIGDELIFSPLPQWLRSENRAMDVDALSPYGGFWNRVEGIGRNLRCRSHLDLLGALRGIPPYDDYDLVIFADFEAPALYRGVAGEARIPRYLEISLGARTAHLFDSARNWLYRLHDAEPYFLNYYRALDYLLRALGLQHNAAARFTKVIRGPVEKPPKRLDVFVSPFTSKYDPSVVYWSRLLTTVVRRAGGDPLCLHVDTGKSWKTQHFALELARSILPTLPSSAEIRLAQDQAGPSLTLPGVYDYLGRCHAVICADSFAAHAAPLFGCTALVIAKSELQDWHVPADGSFYFDAQSPVDEVAESMGLLLAELLRPMSRLEVISTFSQAELDLVGWGDELLSALDGREASEACFNDLYERFADYHRAVAQRRRAAPEPLFRGSFVQDIRPPDRDGGQAMKLHLRDQLERWQNTNFAKYVRRARLRPADDCAAARSPLAAPRPVNGGSILSAVLVDSIRSIVREQRASGEIATYFHFDDGGPEYRRSPLLSTFVHDALGMFDLRSRWVETGFLDALPSVVQGRFVRAAARVRERIRRYLLWDERNEGGWRFYGRASGGGNLDLDATACAATALAQAPRRRPAARWQYHAAMLIGNAGSDVTARVNALRFLAFIGEPTTGLVDEVIAALRETRPVPKGHYGHALALPYCIARTWAQGALPRRAELADLVVPHVLAWLSDSSLTADPLGTSLALNALIDFEYEGAETIAAGQSLLETAIPGAGGWIFGPLLAQGGGSPACTTALAMTALARAGVGR